ncbi:MAG: aspartate-semialdehyde dehydrogenase, partial [Alphaproteobacteria bacterium]|nr:aspartate-semialdehyde dehydrogenase [Alphaproteobacteria bacterium]
MHKIAVIGVEEGLGREVLNLLSEQGVNAKDVYALAPRSALGSIVSYGEDDELDVLGLDTFDFKAVKVAVFATTSEVAKK